MVSGGTLIFVELAAMEGPNLQNSTVAGQNLGVGYFSAPKTGHRRHAYRRGGVRTLLMLRDA